MFFDQRNVGAPIPVPAPPTGGAKSRYSEYSPGLYEGYSSSAGRGALSYSLYTVGFGAIGTPTGCVEWLFPVIGTAGASGDRSRTGAGAGMAVAGCGGATLWNVGIGIAGCVAGAVCAAGCGVAGTSNKLP